MRWLKVTIVFYIVGLLTFYTFAVFDTRAWDIAYFGWAKGCDVGILAWAAIYYSLKMEQRDVVKWMFWFSVVRLLCDVQSVFTGVGVNNEWLVAALFLVLVLVLCYLTITEFKKIKKYA